MRTFGLVGFPLGHSFSRNFFTEKFAKEGKAEQYLNFEIPSIDLVEELILKHPDLVGLNVTIPYKTAIIPFLDELDEVAVNIGAVNTVVIHRSSGGKPNLKGFNTDEYGFRTSLLPLLKSHHQKALVLGTGGASRAVVHALDKLGITSTLVSRSVSNGLIYAGITEEIMQEHTILINTTPLGTYPDSSSKPDVPYQWITDRHLLYDLVYNPPITSFLQEGLDHQAQVKNGYEMLVLQALRAYDIWNSTGNYSG
ncbi:MAG TPA: shikimate dehydrogenase [Prolixibacteraceae bacterium]|nr:shikimate dehydrogenase [Prolixibacteraceae bacterium]